MTSTGSYYFFGRPRRFGKSLLISTLEAYFSGKRDLFKGLAVEKLEKDWIKYPILHLDLNTARYDNKESLLAILNKHFELWEEEFCIKTKETLPEIRFFDVVRCAAEKAGQRVVILVDRYDKPLLQAIGNEALQNEFREYPEGFLLGNENTGPLYPFRVPYRSNEIQQSQRVQ